jgi:beta-1,4-mannosyl-glycoprotein beta-1,4-N-acetylglucosaminyltransferase
MADRQIIDAFLFDGELALLAHRFAETFDLVDTYIIVEAGETFRGNPKPLTFATHRGQFNQYSSKIRHVALPRLAVEACTDPWERERFQRNAVLFALPKLRGDDVLLLLDADEIPSRGILQRLRADGLDRPRRLLMTRHYQYADLLGPRSPCCPAPSEPFASALGRKRPQHWDRLDIAWFSRSGVALPLSALSGSTPSLQLAPFEIRRSTPRAGALPEAGRHLCFVDPSSQPSRKLERVAHAELAGARDQSEQHLALCTRYAVHHRGWWFAERPGGTLPPDLARLIERHPQIPCGARLAPSPLRRIVRSWARIRSCVAVPAALVASVDRNFWLCAPVLVPVMLTIELVRFLAARTFAAPRITRAAEHQHFDG